MTQDLLDRIMGSALSLSRSMRQRMACKDDCDANMLQIHALLYVREHEGMTMKELAKHLKITSPSATSFVNRLVKLKWVERFTDPENRKLVRLKISTTGTAMLQQSMKERKEEMRKVLSLLSPDDQEELARILTHLSDAIHNTTF
jgi:DNA-binding MarR family transcriptional regulator